MKSLKHSENYQPTNSRYGYERAVLLPRSNQVSVVVFNFKSYRKFGLDVRFSQCKLELTEKVSIAATYECGNPCGSLSSPLLAAFRTPLPSAYDYVTVYDILCTSDYLEGDFVNLVVLAVHVIGKLSK